MLDPYVSFSAKFLEEPVMTTVALKTSEPRWRDGALLAPFLDDVGYLESQYVLVAVWDHNTLTEDSLLGHTVFPLKGAGT